MRRKFIALSVVVFMLVTLLPVGVFAADTGSKMNDETVVFTVDQKNYKAGDKLVQTDVAPYIKDLGNGGGRTMVPVAFVAPALGTEPAKWFPNEEKVLIIKGDKQIEIFIGKKELVVNGQRVQMDVAAEIKDIGNGGGRTMLPIAFVAKALEVGHEWNEANRTVHFYGYTKTFDKKGTFGPEKGSETINGSVVVKADGVILQNMVIKGNLTVAEEVGAGDVTLNNIDVKGDTFIRGGGKDSIHINGGQYSNIIVQNVNGQVRIVAQDVKGAQVVIAKAKKGEGVILEGNFDKVTVEAAGAEITTQGQTTINNLEVKDQAKDTKLDLAKDTVVKDMSLAAKADVRGEGKIENANIKSKDVNLGITPGKQTVAPGASKPTTDNKKTSTPSTPGTSSGGGGGSSSSSSGGSSGGSSSSNKVAVSAINVTVEDLNNVEIVQDGGYDSICFVANKGDTLQMKAEVLPANATNKSVAWRVTGYIEDETDVAEIDENGLLTVKKEGDIYVKADPKDGSEVKCWIHVNVKIMSDQLEDNIKIPGAAATEVTGVSIEAEDGKVKIINALQTDDGKVTGDALEQLNSQKFNEDDFKDPNFGYVGYTVEAPKAGELERVVAYSNGKIVVEGKDIKDFSGFDEEKGYVCFYQAIAQQDDKGDWKPYDFDTKDIKLVWYYNDSDNTTSATVIATTWTVESEKGIVEDPAAVVEELIKNLPADKDILENGKDIVKAQNAYNLLSENAKALVSKDSKAKLDQTVSNFKSFTKASVSGLQQAIANAETLDDKIGIVDQAVKNFDFANELGMDALECDHYYEMIIAAKKVLAGPLAAKAVEELIEKLPADKDILDNVWDISATKHAYDELSEDVRY